MFEPLRFGAGSTVSKDASRAASVSMPDFGAMVLRVQSSKRGFQHVQNRVRINSRLNPEQFLGCMRSSEMLASRCINVYIRWRGSAFVLAYCYVARRSLDLPLFSDKRALLAAIGPHKIG